MPILQLLSNNPEEIYKLELQQIIAVCGNGRLLDSSPCSSEFREFLSQAPSNKLEAYANTCLSPGFERSGLALQDVVNELGRRLDYQVVGGLYQGNKNAIGFDGIWRTPDGRAVVVEVKTTDAYRISLDNIATYRQKLIAKGEMSDKSSILIIVGRQDTGELEAQVRGSRHAWDVRLISIDSLVKLVKLKEETEEDTTQKIWDVLAPFEYTRVDRIIDIAFTAAVEANESIEPYAVDENSTEGPILSSSTQVQSHTPQAILEKQRKLGLSALENKFACTLVRRSKATYWSPDTEHRFRAACSVSKLHDSGHYWYAYHPAWDEFLSGGEQSVFLLCCVDRDVAYAIPREWLLARLPFLNQTQVTSEKHYWHIHLQVIGDDHVGFRVHKTGELADISEFEIHQA